MRLKSIKLVEVLILLIFAELLVAARWVPSALEQSSLKLGIVTSNLSIDIADPNNATRTPIKYRPNSPGRLTVGGSYMGLSGTIGLTTPQNEQDRAHFGTTKGQDYQFRLFREQNTFDLFYQKYQGFYVENSPQVDSTLSSSDPLIQRPDLVSEHMGLQYFRTLSPETFSMTACFDQNGWQKESGGSWFWYGSLDQHRLRAEASLIPTALMSQYLALQNFTGGEFATAKFGFGGAYAWIFESYFIAAKLVFAGGQQRQKYQMDGESIDRMLPASGGDGKLSFGFNGESQFISLNVFTTFTGVFIGDREVSLGTTEASLFWGIRL